jgi:hypothetical protein
VLLVPDSYLTNAARLTRLRSEVKLRLVLRQNSDSIGGKWIISRDGANEAQPRWRDHGKEIVYVDLKGVLWAVDLDTGSAIQARTPRQLFQLPAGSNAPVVSGDLKTFLIPVPVEQKVPQAFTVMPNWTSLIKAR